MDVDPVLNFTIDYVGGLFDIGQVDSSSRLAGMAEKALKFRQRIGDQFAIGFGTGIFPFLPKILDAFTSSFNQLCQFVDSKGMAKRVGRYAQLDAVLIL